MSEVVFFYGKYHPLSQHHPCKFIIGEKVYNSAEQFMMSEKALLFNDMDAYHKIMATSDPIRQKQLGRKVRNFDERMWNGRKLGIVYDGNKAKFTQNPELKEYILNTGQAFLAEASPRDRYWGIGFNEETALERKKDWGYNALGSILMKLRDHIRIESS